MKDWRRVLAVAALFAALALMVSGFGVGRRFELALRDRLMHVRGGEAATSVVVVAIDDASLAARGSWPWSRATLAELVGATLEQGATAVAIDILLVDPADDDGILANALGGGDVLLLAGIGTGGDLLIPSAELSHDAELVHGVLELDGDGVLRRISATKQTNSSSYTAMSIAAATRIRPDLAIAVGRTLVPGFTVRPDGVPLVRASDLLAGKGDDDVRGRVAFIGVTATGLGDRAITPVTRLGHLESGVVVHATLAEAFVRNDLVTIAPPWLVALSAAVLVVVASLVGRLRAWKRAAGVIAAVSIPLAAGVALFLVFEVAMPMVLLTGIVVAAVLLYEVMALLSVEESVGRATRAFGVDGPTEGSPAERVGHLEEIAREIADERRQASESHRVVAHELRTPLTSIRGLAQLLAAYDLTDEERRRVAVMVADESARLHVMVEGLLDLERLALRDRGAGMQSIDVGEILAKRGELAAAVGTHEVVLECAEPLPIEGDRALLDRMIENLVGNAMKFSPDGSTVTLRGMNRGGEVVIEVNDEGPGIPLNERENVLRKFGRGKAAADQSGLGLGLAFVAEIARWHGGRVEVDEVTGGGACLRVALPRTREEPSKESSA